MNTDDKDKEPHHISTVKAASQSSSSQFFSARVFVRVCTRMSFYVGPLLRNSVLVKRVCCSALMPASALFNVCV